jgi:hypothetical protein
MSIDLWMGIAIGSLGAWAFLILILLSQYRGRQAARQANDDASFLLLRRNQIGEEQVKKLGEISMNLELLNDTLNRKDKEP